MRTVRGPSQPGLRRLARQALARAVSAGVAETVALSRARGEAIAEPEATAGRGPYRRQTGLDWLAGRGRISPAARAAGELYGQAWRRARLEPSIPSSLEVTPGRGRGVLRPLADVLAHGDGTVMAERRLAAFRAQLSHQRDLVAACDAICGEEKTPREAAVGEREAGRLEAVLKVALDLLATYRASRG